MFFNYRILYIKPNYRFVTDTAPNQIHRPQVYINCTYS